MKPATAPSALRVQSLLGSRFTVLEFEASTRTSAEAAAAIGCTVDQIAKSLLFRGEASGRPILVVMSGAGRVDEKKVAVILGEKIGRADPEFVRLKTGFAIGGVPPLGHAEPPVTLIDQSILAFGIIWAAAGTPNAVFQLTPEDLLDLTQGQRVDVAKNSGASDPGK